MDNVEDQLPSAAEVAEALGTESDEYNLSDEERHIAAKILPKLTAKVTAQAEANKAREIERFITELTEANKAALAMKIEEFQKASTPPTPEELQTLLNQEYAEFTLVIKDRKKAHTFVLRELPVSVETKILSAVNKTLGARLVEINQVDFSAGTTMLEKVQKIMAMVPGVLETVTDCVAVILDPYEEDDEITGDWVRKNIGAQRMTAILHAQVSVSRYRDFLSLASRFFPGMTTL